LKNRILVCAVCLAVAMFGAEASHAQSPGRPPIAKQGFLRAIGIGGLSEAELISFVTDRGVAFVLTPEERETVLKAGHTQKLFDALTESYRGPKLRPLAPNAGPPATQDELLAWLRDGCDEDSIEKAVSTRGVSFPVTADLLGEVEKRGARKSLVEWLQSKRLEAAKAALLTPAEPVPAKEPETKPPTPVPAPAPMVAVAPPVTPVPEPPAAPEEEAELYVMRRVKPVYPADAKRGLSGAVRLKVLVNADGRVEQVNPIEGHPILAAAAEQAVRRWIYEPPTLNGKPSQVETVVKITFKAP
jgi:TonB family protein